MTSPKVLVVGPIPPPVDGRAVATSWLVEGLRQRSVDLVVADTQLEERLTRRLRKVVVCARAAASIAARPPSKVIVVASADFGLIGELLPIAAAARLRSRPVYMTHHSSGYVRRRGFLMSLAIMFGGTRLRHVVLSETMRAELCRRYGVDPARVIVVGNAALMPEMDGRVDVQRDHELIHISNLSAVKGSLVAIEVARRAGVPIRLGGPAAPDAARAISSAMNAGQAIEHLGPVHGEAKAREYLGARVFLFPSPLEAQPLVVYEAAQAGCVPVAWSSGWVREQMAEMGLAKYVLDVGDVDGLVARVNEVVAMDDAAFADLAVAVRAGFAKARANGTIGLEVLADELKC